jgi:uncharacterized protein (TIGR01244 family)
VRKIVALVAAFACAAAPGLAIAADPETHVLTKPFIPLADSFYVSPQIGPEDVAAAKAAGVRLIINNRPDGEAFGQPKGADIAAAAKAAGIDYVEIPIRGLSIGPADLDAFDTALAAHDGPVLAFCRTGTRSTILRSYARARAGDAADAIIEDAAAAGYDIAGQRGALIALGAK